MKYPDACIALFARVPVPGRVKTRLIPALGPDGACALHERLLARILGELEQQELCAAGLWLDAAGQHPLIAACRLPVHLQQGEDLGARMAHALGTMLQRKRFALVIGTDAPQLDAQCLELALQALADGCDIVLGPAFDGGYVLIGMRERCAPVFEGVAWGSSRVLQQTLDLITTAGLRCCLLAPQPDVDEPDDLRHVT
ncbi:MAG: TIGR04282 family arsenosugar biosynthesis glycosyltransferase [Pseudohongiellaceae bacterium]